MDLRFLSLSLVVFFKIEIDVLGTVVHFNHGSEIVNPFVFSVIMPLQKVRHIATGYLAAGFALPSTGLWWACSTSYPVAS